MDQDSRLIPVNFNIFTHQKTSHLHIFIGIASYCRINLKFLVAVRFGCGTYGRSLEVDRRRA